MSPSALLLPASPTHCRSAVWSEPTRHEAWKEGEPQAHQTPIAARRCVTRVRFLPVPAGGQKRILACSSGHGERANFLPSFGECGGAVIPRAPLQIRSKAFSTAVGRREQMGGILSASATTADGISWHAVTRAFPSSPAVRLGPQSGSAAVGFHGSAELAKGSPKGAGWLLLPKGRGSRGWGRTLLTGGDGEGVSP